MKKILALLIVISAISLHVFSQETVKGIVTVAGGNPVSNVEVIVKGTNNKTTTNQHGEFEITVPEGFHILIFNKRGFKQQEIDVKDDRLHIQISFEEYDIFDMSLEDLVKLKVAVASPKARPVIEMPSIVTLITAEDIKNSGARDLLGVLRHIPGLDFAAELDHVVGIGIRGNNSTEGKVLVLIDDQQMNETNFGSFNYAEHILLDNIERIEIIRGPGSAIYGGVAELAVINIITKKGREYNGVHASLHSSFSNNDILTNGIQIGLGNEYKNGLEFSLSASGYQGNKSNYRIPSQTGSLINYADSSAFLSYNLNFGLRYKSLMLRYIFDHQSYDNLEKHIGKVLFEGNFLGLSYEWEIGNNLMIIPSLKWKEQKPWQFIDFQEYEIYNSINNRYTANITTVYDLADKFNLVFGGEYFIDHGKKETNGIVYNSNNKPEIFYNTASAFIEANLYPNIANITIGAHFDFHSQYGSAFVPRFALTKAINRFHTKLMLSSAFKAPTIQNVDINPDIKPETSNIIELELGYQFSKNMLANVNFFNIDISNAIIYEWYDNADHYTNYDKTGTKGFEFEYKIRSEQLHFNFGYSFYISNPNNTIDDYEVEGHDDIYGAYPNHKISIVSNFKVLKKLSITPSLLFYSKRFTYFYDELFNPVLQEYDPSLLMNIYVEYNNLLLKGLRASIGVYDITNQKHRFLNAYKAGIEPIYQPGREYRLKITYDFKI